jgi:hypothetical protein
MPSERLRHFMPPLFLIHAAWDQYSDLNLRFSRHQPLSIFFRFTLKSDSFPLVIPPASRSFSSSFFKRRELHSVDLFARRKVCGLSHIDGVYEG